MIAAVVAVDDAPAVLLATGGIAENPTHVIVKNGGPNTVYVGGAAVTSAAGFPVLLNETFAADLAGGDDLWAICAAAETASLRVLKTQS